MKHVTTATNRKQWITKAASDPKRLGSILVMAAGMMIMVFGFLAFTVDVGYIALTKAQLESATDAGVRAAVIELKQGLGNGATLTSEEVQAAASQAAIQVAAANRAGDQQSVYADPVRDVRLGQVIYDPSTGTWQKHWGVSPYNMVELSLHRDQESAADGNQGLETNGDGPLPLFFAPVIGHDDAKLTTKAVGALLPGNGFRVPSGGSQTADLLPFALDLQTWHALIHEGQGQDNFTVNPKTGSVTCGGDGILEVDLYPYGNQNLPPGNRGTVDLGAGNNSSSDIARQILHGMNSYDFSFFPNNEVKASFDDPLMLNGDTGISAGFKDELESIKGQSRAIPIFTHVSGNGNNAMYRVVKFVGIRIVEVKLTGNPKRVMIQPSPYVGVYVTPDTSGDPIVEDTIFTAPVLIQ